MRVRGLSSGSTLDMASESKGPDDETGGVDDSYVADEGFRTPQEQMKHLDANTLLQLHIRCDIVSFINILAKMFQARDMDPEILN